jgi:hypothetical protein
MTRRALLALLLATAAVLPACSRDAPVPSAFDPQGKDLVKGAVVAAAESNGGIRLYKIVHVDDYPEPAGTEFHMIAYDPKTQTFQEAANLWKHRRGDVKVALDHLFVRLVNFSKRDRRVLVVESVSDEEMQPYLKSLR